MIESNSLVIDPSVLTPADFEKLIGVKFKFENFPFTQKSAVKNIQAFLTFMESQGYEYQTAYPYTFKGLTHWAYQFTKPVSTDD